jgi:hypothetical protein
LARSNRHIHDGPRFLPGGRRRAAGRERYEKRHKRQEDVAVDGTGAIWFTEGLRLPVAGIAGSVEGRRRPGAWFPG